MAPGSAHQRHERSSQYVALCEAERNGSAWRMICFAIASSISSDSMHSLDHAPRCPFEVEARKKSAKQEIAHLLRRRTHTAVHPDIQRICGSSTGVVAS